MKKNEYRRAMIQARRCLRLAERLWQWGEVKIVVGEAFDHVRCVFDPYARPEVPPLGVHQLAVLAFLCFEMTSATGKKARVAAAVRVGLFCFALQGGNWPWDITDDQADAAAAWFEKAAARGKPSAAFWRDALSKRPRTVAPAPVPALAAFPPAPEITPELTWAEALYRDALDRPRREAERVERELAPRRAAEAAARLLQAERERGTPADRGMPAARCCRDDAPPVTMAEVSEAIRWQWDDATNGHYMYHGSGFSIYADVDGRGALGCIHIEGTRGGGGTLRWHHSALTEDVRAFDAGLIKSGCADSLPQSVATPGEVLAAIRQAVGA